MSVNHHSDETGAVRPGASGWARAPRSAPAATHIAQAAKRDRSQLAAHDAALRSRFSGLPTEELVARSEQLKVPARREADAERDLRLMRERVETAEGRLERFDTERVLAERRELTITAARISPPTYVKNELGDRPSDPTKRKAWDHGVTEIETYRQRYGVKDPDKAVGRESRQTAERSRQERARQQLLQTQRALGLRQRREMTRSLGRGLGLFR